MKPHLPNRRTNALQPGLSGNALLVLTILDALGVGAGESVPLKPVYLHWAKRGRQGGSELTEALDELVAAGNIEPFDMESTRIVRAR